MISPVMPTYARVDLAFERGEGVYLFTADGQRYLDFTSGIAVSALGHAHPHLVETLRSQAERLWHVSNLFQIPDQERLARRLVAATFADTVFFTNSGVEACECALKMARKYHDETGNPDRYRVITFQDAFHGRSLATISAAKKDKLTKGFGPLVDGFDQVELGHIETVEAAIGPETAAVLIEPILGEGGVTVVEDGFLRQLRALCDDHGLLLILDEVQCGMGRTGRLFAHEWSGITPDIMFIAKGLGGGFPVGACLATEAAAVGMTAGTHGTTFGGNPLAMAVANAVLDEILADGFLERVTKTANYLHQQLAGLLDRHGQVICEVRGRGLMTGLKCRASGTGLVDALRDRGMLTVAAADEVVRLLPALIVNEDHIRQAMEALEGACQALSVAEEAADQGRSGEGMK